MTQQEFITKLRRLRKRHPLLNQHGSIRFADHHCPLSALARVRTCDGWGAARKLGISKATAERIMDAADYGQPSKLRTQMMKALGLRA